MATTDPTPVGPDPDELTPDTPEHPDHDEDADLTVVPKDDDDA